VLVTYARLPPVDLYNTSEGGLAGGLGRTFVFVNFPTALAAIAVLLLCADRLSVGAVSLAALGAGLCLAVVVPGVVDQDDLDAKPINAVPAAGVAIALMLTVAAARSGGRPVLPVGHLRIVLAGALVVIALPWLFAETGFYAPDPILADEVRASGAPGEESLAAVHLGHHHGTDGVLLALTALLLSRTVAGFRDRRLEAAASAYLALMLAYGVANSVQDFWLEQVVKRGWTGHALPSFLRPQLSLGWLAMIVAAAAIEVLWFRRERRRESLAECRSS
jgi:hypothetical protein